MLILASPVAAVLPASILVLVRVLAVRVPRICHKLGPAQHTAARA
jgi:hypothetical protein